MKTIDDSEILRKVIGGNSNAYSIIIDKYKSKVFTLAYRILKNREDAEEVSQDAFLKCYYALPDFKFGSSFATWLYRIAYTSSIDVLRKRKSESIYLQSNESDYIDDNIIYSEINSAILKFKTEEQKFFLNEAMRKLEFDDSAIIYLFYQAEKSIDEISEIMNMTPSNIKVKLFRARKKLLDNLKLILRKDVVDLI